EWPKGADCKSAGSAFDGSNPSPSTIFLLVIILWTNCEKHLDSVLGKHVLSIKIPWRGSRVAKGSRL
ncbi:hypothetical protein DC365_25005, partial [Vibrio vulnificus]